MATYGVFEATKATREEIAIPANFRHFTVTVNHDGNCQESVAELCDETHARLFAQAAALRASLALAVKYLRRGYDEGCFADCALPVYTVIRRAEEVLSRAPAL